MSHAFGRKIALAAAAVAILSASQASAAEGLTVHCTVINRYEHRKPIKTEELYFLDIAAGKFCTAQCDVIFNIESASDLAISLHASSDDIYPELIMPNWEARVRIDRKGGALTGRTISSGSSVSRASLTGRCTFLPSLSQPIAMALRSAPPAARATFADPERERARH